MTREEAIQYNKNLREYMKISDKKSEYKFLEENYIALDMANKALEIVNDFESAQIITGGRLNGRTYAYKCGLADGQRLAKDEDILERTRWIPVSERLPEEGQQILFSTKTDEVFEGAYFNVGEGNRNWYAYRDENYAWNNVVTAWMPLPEPYKAESKEMCNMTCKEMNEWAKTFYDGFINGLNGGEEE